MGLTSISWTDYSLNVVRGCRRVSRGCENCYAEVLAHRFSTPGSFGHGLTTIRAGRPTWTGDIQEVPAALLEPFRWTRPRRTFVCSISDLFYDQVAFTYIAAFFGVAAATISTYQVLTKRPERAAEFFRWLDDASGGSPVAFCEEEARNQLASLPVALRSLSAWRKADVLLQDKHRISMAGWPPTNVWIGVSVEGQREFDERIPYLERCPGFLRFLSVEPLLEPISFGKRLANVGWVIVGGESGPRARPCDARWIEDVVSQAKNASCAVFVKQLGSNPMSSGGYVHLTSRKGDDLSEWPPHLRVQEIPG